MRVRFPYIAKSRGVAFQLVSTGSSFAPALDEQRRHAKRVVARRLMQWALFRVIFDLDRHAEVDQKRDDIGTIPLCGREHRQGGAQVLRVLLEDRRCLLTIEPEADLRKYFDSLAHNCS